MGWGLEVWVVQLIDLAVNSFTSYSMLPLKLAGYLGALITILFGAFGAFVFVEMFILDDPLHFGVSNVTMLALLLTFLIGIVMACLGLVALYIGHIHNETKNRPLYVVRHDIYHGQDYEEDYVEGQPT